MGQQNVSPTTRANRGGGNQKAVGLTAAQLAIIGGLFAELDPAWFKIRGFEGGEMRPDRTVEELENEDGDVDDEVVTKDRYLIGETTHNTSDAALDLIEALEDLRFPMRVPLPVRDVGAQGQPLHQLWLFETCYIRKGNEGINMANGVRKRKFEVVALLTDEMRADGWTKPFRRATVDMAAQETWPADMVGAKDTRFQAGA